LLNRITRRIQRDDRGRRIQREKRGRRIQGSDWYNKEDTERDERGRRIQRDEREEDTAVEQLEQGGCRERTEGG
jgi:hypothetical protein